MSIKAKIFDANTGKFINTQNFIYKEKISSATNPISTTKNFKLDTINKFDILDMSDDNQLTQTYTNKKNNSISQKGTKQLFDILYAQPGLHGR